METIFKNIIDFFKSIQFDSKNRFFSFLFLGTSRHVAAALGCPRQRLAPAPDHLFAVPRITCSAARKQLLLLVAAVLRDTISPRDRRARRNVTGSTRLGGPKPRSARLGSPVPAAVTRFPLSRRRFRAILVRRPGRFFATLFAFVPFSVSVVFSPRFFLEFSPPCSRDPVPSSRSDDGTRPEVGTRGSVGRIYAVLGGYLRENTEKKKKNAFLSSYAFEFWRLTPLLVDVFATSARALSESPTTVVCSRWVRDRVKYERFFRVFARIFGPLLIYLMQPLRLIKYLAKTGAGGPNVCRPAGHLPERTMCARWIREKKRKKNILFFSTLLTWWVPAMLP